MRTRIYCSPMKKTLLILTLLVTSTMLLAQEKPTRRGVALGVDRDTLLFLIASPFDNWYINLSGGIQTYIGNPPDAAAYWNKLDFGGRVEVGKWIIPDLAVSVRLGAFRTSSQSRFAGNNPWVDITQPLLYEGAVNGPYYPMTVFGLGAMGIVTFDWTNFLSGFEVGKRKKLHIYTPLALGGVWLVGKTINQNYVDRATRSGIEMQLGDIIWNKELAFSGGLMAEYFASPELSFNLAAEVLGARGSLDDHNYNVQTDKRHVDWIPSLYAGVKLNLLKEVVKYKPHSKTSQLEPVNHQFLTIGSRGDLERQKKELERKNGALDSLAKLIVDNNGQRDDLIRKYDSIADELEALKNEIDQLRQPENMIEELVAFNENQGLPAVTVYFQLDRYELDYNAHRRLQNFAQEANQLNDTLVFYVIGAADSATGSIPHNVWLSERRSEVVYNALVKEYNVKAERLVPIPIGGITDYDPKEYNRMGMVMLRTPETEEIVKRWLREMKERLR